MTNSKGSSAERAKIMAMAGYNLDLVPSFLVQRDYQTDSLMNVDVSSASCSASQGDTDALLAESLGHIFGMPYLIPVSQGRLAECILANALIRKPGQAVLGSACFPTTKIHLEISGAQVFPTPTASDSSAVGPALFQGDIDVAALNEQIRRIGAENVSHLFLEPCTNATGGHPISLENIKEVRELADQFGLPLYLDATRIISNACLIQKRSPQHRNYSIRDLVAKICGYADGLTLSATKEFPSSIGGLIGTRDKSIFQRCLDRVILVGSGLDLSAKRAFVAATRDFNSAVSLVESRIARVQRLHQLIARGFPRSEPPGAHAVFLNGESLREAVPSARHAERAFLNRLFVLYGIRGMLNPGCYMGVGSPAIRFAVPIIGKSDAEIEADAEAIEKSMMEEAPQLVDLEEVSRPSGRSGGLMATYREVEKGLA